MKKIKRTVSLILALVCCFGVLRVAAPQAGAYAAAKPLPALTGNKAQDVANIAISQLGYAEGSDGGTVYGAWWTGVTNWGYNYTWAGWCSMFAMWCAAQGGAGLGVAFDKNGAIPANCLNWLLKNASGDTSFSVAPRPGDFIFFGNGGIGHVAIVVAYNSGTNEVTFVGGNQGNKVSQFTMKYTPSAPYGSQYIKGIGRPNYGNSPIVVPGCSCDAGFAGNYTCITTTDPLNIRSGHSTAYSVVGTIPPGATVHVSKAQGLSDNSWAHVEYNGVKGYCSMQFLKRMPQCADGSHTDSDEDLWCDTCGTDTHFILNGANLKLGDSLTMFFYVEKSDLQTGKNYYAIVEREYADGREHQIQRLDMQQWEDFSKSEYRIAYTGISAKEMSDKITITVYNEQDMAVSLPWADSIRDYTVRILKKEQSDSSKRMFVNLLNYGAAAQKFFGYANAQGQLANEALYNGTLDAGLKNYAQQTQVLTDARVQGLNYTATTISCKNSMTLTLYFKNVSADMTAKIRYTDHYGNKKETTVAGKDFFYDAKYDEYGVDVTGISMGSYASLITVEIYNGSTLAASASDSIGSYLRRQLDKPSHDEFYDAAAKVLTSAYTYLHP